jgi:hypothetical protein
MQSYPKKNQRPSPINMTTTAIIIQSHNLDFFSLGCAAGEFCPGIGCPAGCLAMGGLAVLGCICP